MVHNQSAIPFTLSKGISIQSGYETYVGVNRVFTTKRGPPYSSCISDFESTDAYVNKLFDYFEELNVTYYDQEFCFKLCYQDQLLSKCNCLDIKTPLLNNSSYCVNDSEIECLKSFDAYFTTADIPTLCKCPQQCEIIEYNFQSSFSKYPTSSYLQLMASNYDFDHFFPYGANLTELIAFANIGILKLIVNYDNLYYTSFEDNPAISADAVWAQIGGELGN